MNSLKTKSAMRSLFCRIAVVVFIAVTLAGCEGGILGTSAGPTTRPGDGPVGGGESIYQLMSLPDRIRPDIPETLLRGQELAPSEPQEHDATDEVEDLSLRVRDTEPVDSFVWRAFNTVLVENSRTHAIVQMNATIVDVAFNDIVDHCADHVTDCLIPAGQIRVQLTQDVIGRLNEIVVDLLDSVPSGFLGSDLLADWRAVVNQQFALLVDSEVVFGETHYSRLDGSPYHHSVRTLLKRKPASDEVFAFRLWRDDEFHARWANDGSVAKFLINADDLLIQEYFYQDAVPSELVIARDAYLSDDLPFYSESNVKIVANNPEDAGVLVEIARPFLLGTGQSEDGEPLRLSGYEQFQLQIDNAGGYGTFDYIDFDVTDMSRPTRYNARHDSFNNIGKLIAGIDCSVSDSDQGVEICNQEDFRPVSHGQAGALITDSPNYFLMEEFDSLVGVHDSTQWKIQGLPAEVKAAAVVSRDSTLAPSERELLCRGFRYFGEDMRTFCSASDEQLDNVIVLELIDGIPGELIPSASLVPF